MNWSRYRLVYFLISLVVLIPGAYSLIRFGLRPAIDFTGGSLVEIKLTQPVDLDLIKTVAGQENLVIKNLDNNIYSLKTDQISPSDKDQLLANLETGLGKVEELSFETLGPTIGQELVKKTLLSVALATGFILLYVANRFKDKKYGICAILAMFHDTLILLGIFSLLGHFYGVEVDALFVTAVLTVLSFSVHDTVVVYDRIRELSHKQPRTEFAALVNQAITETLTRSINNSMTIIFMLLALYLLGGQTMRDFTLALLIGTVAGTYSSTFTAAPLLVVWYNRLEKKT